MAQNNSFDITILKSINNRTYDPPTDYLDEFEDFEMNFKRFFYDFNYKVLLKIKNQKERFDFYPEILEAFDSQLCEQILLLSNKNYVCLYFGEMRIEFYPDENEDKVNCVTSYIGVDNSISYTLCLSQIIRKLSYFINQIFSMAIKHNYIDVDDIPKLVEWKFNRGDRY